MRLSPAQLKLHNQAIQSCAEHRRLEAEIVGLLLQIERQRIFRFLGYTSLFNYAVKALGLSEATAYAFITVARKCGECSELMVAIEKQDLSVSKASRMVSALSKENPAELIEFAKAHTSREIDYEVARLQPGKKGKDRTKPISEEEGELKCALPLDALAKLERVRSLLSSKLGRAASIGEALHWALGDCLEKRDPVARAKRAGERRAKRAAAGSDGGCSDKTSGCGPDVRSAQTEQPFGNSVQAQPEQPFGDSVQTQTDKPARNSTQTDKPARDSAQAEPRRRKPLTASQKHAVHARDGARCTFTDPNTGEQCSNDRWLHVHHRIPRSQGGSNDPANLTTLCAAHHDLAHQLSLPLDGQVTWLREVQIAYRTG